MDAATTTLLEIGPLRVWLTRFEREWRLALDRSGVDDEAVTWVRHTDPGAPPADAETVRYVMRETEPDLAILPALGDRPVVTRPVTPFFIPPGQETTIFVSTPIWVQVRVHHERVVLHEIPIVRPSDTWFGPSTLEGELAYATRTSARLNLSDVPTRPHRAITPARIRNEAPSPLFLERLSVPVPSLPLFSADERLWTPRITLVRESDDEMAAIHVDEKAPAEAGPARQVQEARRKISKGALVRAFSVLFD